MGDDGGSLPVWLIVMTFATSAGFFVAYGSQVFDSVGEGSCEDPFDCVGTILAFMGDLFQFAFISAFTANLPTAMALIVFFFVNLPWLIIIIRLFIAIALAIATAVPF